MKKNVLLSSRLKVERRIIDSKRTSETLENTLKIDFDFVAKLPQSTSGYPHS
jgi:hypothetical protein